MPPDPSWIVGRVSNSLYKPIAFVVWFHTDPAKTDCTSQLGPVLTVFLYAKDASMVPLMQKVVAPFFLAARATHRQGLVVAPAATMRTLPESHPSLE